MNLQPKQLQCSALPIELLRLMDMEAYGDTRSWTWESDVQSQCFTKLDYTPPLLRPRTGSLGLGFYFLGACWLASYSSQRFIAADAAKPASHRRFSNFMCKLRSRKGDITPHIRTHPTNQPYRHPRFLLILRPRSKTGLDRRGAIVRSRSVTYRRSIRGTTWTFTAINQQSLSLHCLPFQHSDIMKSYSYNLRSSSKLCKLMLIDCTRTKDSHFYLLVMSQKCSLLH